MTDARLNAEMEGRCMKCKEARPFIATEINVMKNGGYMAKGTCGICGTTICRMLGKNKTEDEGEGDTASLASLLPKVPVVDKRKKVNPAPVADMSEEEEEF